VFSRNEQQTERVTFLVINQINN